MAETKRSRGSVHESPVGRVRSTRTNMKLAEKFSAELRGTPRLH